MQTKIVKSPAIADFIIRITLFVKTCSCMYKSRYKKRRIFRPFSVKSRQALLSYPLCHLVTKNTVIPCSFRVFPRWCFCCGSYKRFYLLFCYLFTAVIFSYASSAFNKLLKFHLYLSLSKCEAHAYFRYNYNIALPPFQVAKALEMFILL